MPAVGNLIKKLTENPAEDKNIKTGLKSFTAELKEATEKSDRDIILTYIKSVMDADTKVTFKEAELYIYFCRELDMFEYESEAQTLEYMAIRMIALGVVMEFMSNPPKIQLKQAVNEFLENKNPDIL